MENQKLFKITNQVSGIKFNTEGDANGFADLSPIDMAKRMEDELDGIVKRISENSLYIFNTMTKLWQEIVESEFESYIDAYIDDTHKNYKQMCTKNKHYMSIVFSCARIIKYFKGVFYDLDFVSKYLNKKNDHLPINGYNKINLRTGEISQIIKEDYFTSVCPVDYVENTPHADKFFKQIMPLKENREYLRKVSGYSLTGETKEQVFFILMGKGSNGKSVYSKLLQKILGKFYVTCGDTIFNKPSKGASEEANPSLVALYGTRTAIYVEGATSDEVSINYPVLKRVTGQDPIKARGLYKGPIEFEANCKLMYVTNYIPSVDGDDAAVRRTRGIYFYSCFVDYPDVNKPNEFKKDSTFTDSLYNEYLSEVFSWMVKGAIQYYKDKHLNESIEFKKLTEQHTEKEDSITSFFRYKLSITNDLKNDKIKRTELFERYQAYSNRNSQRCKPRSTFFARIDALGILSVKNDGYDYYKGIKFTESNKLPQSMFDENAFDKGVDKSDQSVDVISKYKKQIEELNRQSAKQIEELNRQIILMKIEKYLNENKTFLENHIPIMEKYNDIYQQCIKPKQQKKTKTVRITKEKYNKLSVLFN